jgi:hypothetical protein
MTDLQDLGPWGDWSGEMRPVRLDAHTADRLLAGAVNPDDAPPGYVEVSRLLGAARDVGAHPVTTRDEPTVLAMSAALAEHLAPAPAEKRGTSMLTKMLSLKAAAAASAVLLGAGTAAAATGSLPNSAQTTASDVLHEIGISVPGSDSHSDGHANIQSDSTDHTTGAVGAASDESEGSEASDTPETSETSEEGNGPNVHATFGLCTARAANDGHPDTHSAVFPSAATCASVTHPGNDEGADPGTGSSTETAGTGSTIDHPEGPPTGTPGAQPTSTPGSDNAPVQTPNEGAASTNPPHGGSNPSESGPAPQHGNGGASARGDAASHGGPSEGSAP